MKLLALEASQNSEYYKPRYQQIVDLGADLYVLNGIGTDDFWPAARYRRAGSRHVDDLIRHATAWHAEEHFDGVFTFSESAVVAVAAVADALGLPGVGLQAAITSRNKLIMRQAHERGGVAHPHFRIASDVDAALEAAEEFGYPVVIKPTLGAASNFVFRVDDAGQLRERYSQCRTGMDRMIWFNMEVEGIDLELSTSPLPGPDEIADQKRARQLLDSLLERMDPDTREVLVLFEVEEFAIAEIAEILSIPIGTVGSRLFRAREEFQRLLRAYERTFKRPEP